MPTISVPFELERYSIKYEFSGALHCKILCPFHDDTTPSCNVELETGNFKCWACGKHGDVFTLLAAACKPPQTRDVVFLDLAKRYDLNSDKASNPLDVEMIERYHERIWVAEPLLMQLRKRGISEETIRKRRLGERQGRIQIPIPVGNVFVNIRKYLPGAPAAQKFKNSTGRGKNRLYPDDQLKYDTIVICGGEIKALAVGERLNPKNIGAISTTGGEGNWDQAFTKEFLGKVVYICYDIDETGVEAAQTIAGILRGIARKVFIVNLAKVLNIDTYPHGDVNNFIGEEGGNALRLVDDLAEEYVPRIIQPLVLAEAKPVTFARAYTAEHVGQRIELCATVSAVDRSPYMLPKEVQVYCDKDQKVCPLCPISRAESKPKFMLEEESAKLIELAGAPDGRKQDILKSVIGIPSRCRAVNIVPTLHIKMEDARISPQIDVASLESVRTMQPVAILGEFDVEANRTVKLQGTVCPNPNSQIATIVCSKYELIEDTLSNFADNQTDDLNVFKVREHTLDALKDRLDAIYLDFEDNITRVVCRRSLHIAVDLAYHSVLFLNVKGKTFKGWTECLILGDSSQGKSETAINLMKHYDLGEKVECKNASVAGLLGGVQNLSGNSRWFITWGSIPKYDRRLVMLEEVKGASTKIISQLTDMRSSGIAELDKIEKAKTRARTRLIWISNAREEGRAISSYPFGIEAVRELFGHLEDVRRLDFAVIVSSADITEQQIRAAKERKKVPHVYTSELCKRLVLWAWTRTIEQTRFEDEAHLHDVADKLCGEYTEAIPLVDKGSMVYKLGRLSAAIAARVFSTDDNGNLLIRNYHIDYIAELLRETYNHTNFMYGGHNGFTDATQRANNVKDPQEIRNLIQAIANPQDFIDQLLYKDKFDAQDAADFTGWDRQQVADLISLLVRKQAIIKEGRTYYKTPGFITFLRGLDFSKPLPKHLDQGPENFK